MTLPRIPYRRSTMNPDGQSDALARFGDVLERRRSVRDFSSEPVPRQLVVDAIRVAGLAPSGAHQQPWTFVLIGDEPELRARIREAAERPYVVIPVGYPAADATVPDLARKPLSEILVELPDRG